MYCLLWSSKDPDRTAGLSRVPAVPITICIAVSRCHHLGWALFRSHVNSFIVSYRSCSAEWQDPVDVRSGKWSSECGAGSA